MTVQNDFAPPQTPRQNKDIDLDLYLDVAKPSDVSFDTRYLDAFQ